MKAHVRDQEVEVRQGARLDAVFAAIEPRLGRFIAQMLDDRERGAELLQDTFLAAHRDRDRLGEVRNVEAWLFGIARNRVLMELRARRRARHALARLAVWRSHGHCDPDIGVDVRDLLRRALAPEDRVLLVLRYVHDFSAPELAEITGSTPAAVRQRLIRARRRVLAEIDSAGPDRGSWNGA